MSDIPKVHVGSVLSGSELAAGENGVSVVPVEKPMVFGEYPGLSACLREGIRKKGGCVSRIHAFLSGGGLRVVRMELDEVLKGYGEHPHVEEALRICEEDYQAGTRKYEDVYGKLYPHYWTGSSTPSGKLDSWTRSGRSWDIYMTKDGKFVFDSEYYYQVLPSKERSDRVQSTLAAEEWVSPTTGCKYLSEPIRMHSGIGTSTKVIEKNGAPDAMMVKRALNVEADTLEAVLAAAEAKISDLYDNLVCGQIGGE